MPTITQQKCACDDCLCIVEINEAVKKDDKNYCSTACADGHPGGASCALSSCACES